MGEISEAGRANIVIATAIATLVLIALGIGIGFVVARGMSRPIEALAELTRQIGQGRYDVEIPFQRSDEIGELADTLKDMAAARKTAEEELRAAKDEADAASRAKSDFLSAMSHELRTPLNAVLGFAQLLERHGAEPLTETQREYVEYILTSGQLLLELIEDILDLAKIEAGKAKLRLEDLSPGVVVAECLTLSRNMADGRGVEIDDRVSGRDLPLVRADGMRLKQVLLNLLSNAVKYNRDGGTVILDCREGADGMLRLGVSDTGPGVPEDRQGEMFEPFNRLGAESGVVAGTGIGLYVARPTGRADGGKDRFREHRRRRQHVLDRTPLGTGRHGNVMTSPAPARLELPRRGEAAGEWGVEIGGLGHAVSRSFLCLLSLAFGGGLRGGGVGTPGPARPAGAMVGGLRPERLWRPIVVRQRRSLRQSQLGRRLLLRSGDRCRAPRGPSLQPRRRRSRRRRRIALLALRGPPFVDRAGRIHGHRRRALDLAPVARGTGFSRARHARPSGRALRRHLGLARRPAAFRRRRPHVARPHRPPDGARHGEPLHHPRRPWRPRLRRTDQLEPTRRQAFRGSGERARHPSPLGPKVLR